MTKLIGVDLMIRINCAACGKLLENGTDNFGDTETPLCEACHLDFSDELSGMAVYGLAPHHHNRETADGSYIRSTVIDPLPEPNENGVYDLGYATFEPDPDVPGLGTWTYK